MTQLHDEEFGDIAVRRSALAKYVRIKVGPNGKLAASLPKRAPLRLVQQLIDRSRDELRQVLTENVQKPDIHQHGALLGKSHQLIISHTDTPAPKSSIAQQKVTIQLPHDTPAESEVAQTYIRDVLKKVLKKEAQSYLPRRVHYLADTHGFTVNTVRFNNAKTRWGSCTSKQSINLNIALMQLPFELIDYVIIHELCHTRHLNHGTLFWDAVQNLCPHYKTLRKQLRLYHPYI